jgi:hypothetical protein
MTLRYPATIELNGKTSMIFHGSMMIPNMTVNASTPITLTAQGASTVVLGNIAVNGNFPLYGTVVIPEALSSKKIHRFTSNKSSRPTSLSKASFLNKIYPTCHVGEQPTTKLCQHQHTRPCKAITVWPVLTVTLPESSAGLDDGRR